MMQWIIDHKRSIAIAIAVLLLLSIAVSYVFSRLSQLQQPSETVSTYPPGPSFGSGGTTVASTSGGNISVGIGSTSALSLETQTGTITVLNFIQNGETGADPQNPGKYFLAGSPGYCLPNAQCPGGYATNSFNITFDSTKQFFSIVLLNEPLGSIRKQAEQFLAERLGISSGQLCTLNYYVSTVSAINEFYAGKNLGFSFCPGATPLP